MQSCNKDGHNGFRPGPNCLVKRNTCFESCRAAADPRNARNFVRLKKLGRIVIHLGTDSCCCATRLNIINYLQIALSSPLARFF